MAANVETMFYTREKPWHNLGVRVQEAPESSVALEVAGLKWEVLQKPIYTDSGEEIAGYKANVRDIDGKVFGVVSNRYKVVQNEEAFAFTDELLGNGVRYETAGSLQEGRKVWLLARLPREYIIMGEQISPYLVFSNSHDGSGAVKVAITPIRVVCNNTLNLALSTAKRSFSMILYEIIPTLDCWCESQDDYYYDDGFWDDFMEEIDAAMDERLEELQLQLGIQRVLSFDDPDEERKDKIRSILRMEKGGKE